jgi:hypothetical protein
MPASRNADKLVDTGIESVLRMNDSTEGKVYTRGSDTQREL